MSLLASTLCAPLSHLTCPLILFSRSHPTFSDFSTVSSKAAVRDSLQATYSDINDVDAWVGALSEDHVYVCVEDGGGRGVGGGS